MSLGDAIWLLVLLISVVGIADLLVRILNKYAPASDEQAALESSIQRWREDRIMSRIREEAMDPGELAEIRALVNRIDVSPHTVRGPELYRCAWMLSRLLEGFDKVTGRIPPDSPRSAA